MNLFCRLYALPISYMVVIPLIGVGLWIILGIFIKTRWKMINTALMCAGLLIILYATIINRTPGDYYVSFEPFYTFKNNPTNDEIYRTTFLNTDMFIPFGLGLAGILSERLPIYKTWTMLLCTGFSLSFLIELVQYFFSIGNAEIDDVIFNVLGVAIAGVAALLLVKIKDSLEVIHEKRKKD